MPTVVVALGVVLLAYLLGCFSTGYYLVRLRTGQDLRTMGSGATGGRNVARFLGPAGFLLTGAGDLAKSVVAVGVPIWLGLGALEVAAAMVAVTAGHIWPFQLGFRGGKGIAPFVGATALVAPLALVAGAVLAAVAVLLSRRPNIGGMAGFAATPAVALALGQPIPIAVGIFVVVALGAIAHRSNLREELRSAPPHTSRRRLAGPLQAAGRLPGAGRLPFIGRWTAEGSGGGSSDG